MSKLARLFMRHPRSYCISIACAVPAPALLVVNHVLGHVPFPAVSVIGAAVLAACSVETLLDMDG